MPQVRSCVMRKLRSAIGLTGLADSLHQGQTVTSCTTCSPLLDDLDVVSRTSTSEVSSPSLREP